MRSGGGLSGRRGTRHNIPLAPVSIAGRVGWPPGFHLIGRSPTRGGLAAAGIVARRSHRNVAPAQSANATADSTGVWGRLGMGRKSPDRREVSCPSIDPAHRSGRAGQHPIWLVWRPPGGVGGETRRQASRHA